MARAEFNQFGNIHIFRMDAEILGRSIAGHIGFCVACGNVQDDIDPHAQKIDCKRCKKPKVYGAKNLFLMGGIHLE